MIAAALLSAFLLVFVLLAARTDWSNVLSPARNELVFAGRNKAYGAYAIRREHHRTMVAALFSALGLVLAMLLPPRFLASAPPAPPLPPPKGEIIFVVTPPTPPDPAKQRLTPVTPRHRSTVPTGIPTAMDSVEAAPVDTTSASNTPGPTDGTGDALPDTDGTSGDNDESTTGPLVREAYQADSPPEYPGGEPSLYRFLRDNVNYPDPDHRAGRQGRVVVSFVVAADGSVTDIRVVRGISPTIDAEAVRVVRKMKRWKPGQYQGENVPVRFSLPIVFKLR